MAAEPNTQGGPHAQVHRQPARDPVRRRRRQVGVVQPLPRSLKVHKATGTTVHKSLLKKGLVAERPAVADEAHWRKWPAQDAGHRRYRLLAIGIASDEVPSTRAIATKLPPKQRSRRAERTPSAAKATTNKPPPAARQGTKQALPIDLLKRKCGVTITEAIRRRYGTRAKRLIAAGWSRRVRP